MWRPYRVVYITFNPKLVQRLSERVLVAAGLALGLGLAVFGAAKLVLNIHQRMPLFHACQGAEARKAKRKREREGSGGEQSGSDT